MRSWGTLQPFKDNPVLHRVLHGRMVVDLGAGNLTQTRQLVRFFEPGLVTAVEKELVGRVLTLPQVVVYRGTFEEFARQRTPYDVAFLSYAVNCPVPGLIELLERAPVVVVLSANFDGLATGWPKLWQHLSLRELLAYDPHPDNSLSIYGPRQVSREQTPDEKAGMDWDSIHPHPSRR